MSEKHSEEKRLEFAEACGFDSAFLWKTRSEICKIKYTYIKTIDHRSARGEQTQTGFQALPLTPSQPNSTCIPPASRRAVTGLLNHQLPAALGGWNKTALYIAHGKERESCCFSLLLCWGAPGEEPWLTGARQGNISTIGHLKRCQWQWELEGFSVPLSPLGMEV